MSTYKNVTVSREGETYFENATASLVGGASKIVVTGTPAAEPEKGDRYLIKNDSGLFDTHGTFLKNEEKEGKREYIFENNE